MKTYHWLFLMVATFPQIFSMEIEDNSPKTAAQDLGHSWSLPIELARKVALYSETVKNFLELQDNEITDVPLYSIDRIETIRVINTYGDVLTKIAENNNDESLRLFYIAELRKSLALRTDAALNAIDQIADYLAIEQLYELTQEIMAERIEYALSNNLTPYKFDLTDQSAINKIAMPAIDYLYKIKTRFKKTIKTPENRELGGDTDRISDNGELLTSILISTKESSHESAQRGVWSTKDGALLYKYPQVSPSGNLLNLEEISKNGRELAYSSYEDKHRILIADIETGEILRSVTLPINYQLVYSYALSPDFEFIAACNINDGTIQLLSTKTNTTIGTIQYEQSNELDYINMYFSANNKHLVVEFTKSIATGTRDTRIYPTTLKTFNLDSGKEIGEFGYNKEFPLGFYGTDNKFFTINNNGDLNVWNTATNTLENTLPTNDRTIYHIAFSHDKRKIATTSLATGLKLWDMKKRSLLNTIAIPESTDFTNHILITFNTAGNLIVHNYITRDLFEFPIATNGLQQMGIDQAILLRQALKDGGNINVHKYGQEEIEIYTTFSNEAKQFIEPLLHGSDLYDAQKLFRSFSDNARTQKALRKDNTPTQSAPEESLD